MKVFSTLSTEEIVPIIRSGGIGILRTDTLYGIVADANNEEAVQRIYRLKHRNEKKSPILLIASIDQMFDGADSAKRVARNYWPGKVSIIFPSAKAPVWIRRQNESVAYRMPDDTALRKLLEATGPLVAPSANPQGEPPAVTVEQAIEYFGDAVDFYVDGGSTASTLPSRIVRIHDDDLIEELR